MQLVGVLEFAVITVYLHYRRREGESSVSRLLFSEEDSAAKTSPDQLSPVAEVAVGETATLDILKVARLI